VPKHVAYKAKCGDKTLWVAREDVAGLSEFTLIVLDIATTDPTSLVVLRPTASVSITEKMTNCQPDPATIENIDDSTKTPQPLKGDRITETWLACQDTTPGSIGQITVSRPKVFKDRSSFAPAIVSGDIAASSTPISPLSPRALGLPPAPLMQLPGAAR
jgi:hypothetical protein